jgi:aldehyde dehydrogenase (NAD+)
MVSFTGSTRAGIEVAKNAAATVKRVTQELGGKSANILVDDAGFPAAVKRGVAAVMNNSGQSCNAPTRMLVPHSRMEEAAALAGAVAAAMTVGAPDSGAQIGPVVSRAQFEIIQGLVRAGIDEGARLVAGGPGRPQGLETGHFVRPTVFADVDNGMAIARTEVFGPVIAIIGYHDEADAIRIANDSDFGLAAYVQAADPVVAERIALQLRAGQVSINGAWDIAAPFGGYRMSGNGREWGETGFHEFLETKAVLGCPA